jgi:hypothetical protein
MLAILERRLKTFDADDMALAAQRGEVPYRMDDRWI